MGKIIAVAQHKGGTAKTTTCINLGASLCGMGKCVLLIDFDPQASLTLSLGIDPLEIEKWIHHVLINPVVAMSDGLDAGCGIKRGPGDESTASYKWPPI